MRKLGKHLTANLVEMIRDTKNAAEYFEGGVDFKRAGTTVRCFLDGTVNVFGLWGQSLPLDWDQRRGIARAVRWRHKVEQDALIRLGQEKAREQETR